MNRILSIVITCALVCVPAVTEAQSRVYLARTETCTPECRSSVRAVTPDTLAVTDVATLPIQIDSQPYLTSDGRLLVWYVGAFTSTAYRLAIYDLASRELTVVPWNDPPPEEMVGNPRRPEVYVSAGGKVMAMSESGARQLPSPTECVNASLRVRDISADGRRLLASCVTGGLAQPIDATFVIDLDAEQVIWQHIDHSHWYGSLSADGRLAYNIAGNLITSISLGDGQPVATVMGLVLDTPSKIHVETATGRVVAIGRNDTRVYEPETLQLVAVWPTSFNLPLLTDVASVAFDSPTRRLFMASGSPILATGPRFGDYHVIDTLTGNVVFAVSAGPRGLPDVGWFVAAPVPGAPQTLGATVQGGAVALTWTAGSSDAQTVRYVVEAGSAPGLANLATFDVGLQTNLTVPGVPPGTYYVRVRAANYTGSSAPSNEIVVTVP